jgi:hypothetical protein
LIWFTLTDGESIAVAPEHVRYIRPTEDGGETVIHFSRDDYFTVTQTPIEVVARLTEKRRSAPRAKAAS